MFQKFVMMVVGGFCWWVLCNPFLVFSFGFAQSEQLIIYELYNALTPTL